MLINFPLPSIVSNVGLAVGSRSFATFFRFCAPLNLPTFTLQGKAKKKLLQCVTAAAYRLNHLYSGFRNILQHFKREIPEFLYGTHMNFFLRRMDHS